MKFSIITPSLQRQSLRACCESLDAQSFQDWEQIVMLDLPDHELDWEFLSTLASPRRFIKGCGQRFGHYGNHARWMAWEHATGDYLVMLDDDNIMMGADALQNIYDCLEGSLWPDWGLFPIHRHGSRFFMVPPGLCMTDTANVVVKREIGRWPDIEAREADGIWVESLKANYSFAVGFPNCPPIVLMEKSSNGE